MSKSRIFYSTVFSLLVMTALAQDTGKRIITIDFSGGSQRMENLRYGPISYTHPDPEGIKAVVSNLTIFAHEASLRGPEGEQVPISQAQGQRVATFNDGVRVKRNRLDATGPDLVYSEATGLGTLTGGADILVAPKEEGADPVTVTAREAEFDVDTDVSVSKGNVQLTNGNQSAEADTLEFEEDRNLAMLTCAERQCVITRTDDDGKILTINADVIRVLTDAKTFRATGNVTIVDGDTTSTGNEVFFDDETSIAEVIGAPGKPAKSVNAASGATLESARIKQDIEYDFVEPIDSSVPSEFDPAVFKLTREG